MAENNNLPLLKWSLTTNPSEVRLTWWDPMFSLQHEGVERWWGNLVILIAINFIRRSFKLCSRKDSWGCTGWMHPQCNSSMIATTSNSGKYISVHSYYLFNRGNRKVRIHLHAYNNSSRFGKDPMSQDGQENHWSLDTLSFTLSLKDNKGFCYVPPL